MTLDLDRLEALAKAVQNGDWEETYALSEQWQDVVALIAEVRALRAELNTPLLTGAYAPMYDGIFAAEGINHGVAMSAFYANAPTVTVYYGKRHVYTCMAEFCAEYSKEPT